MCVKIVTVHGFHFLLCFSDSDEDRPARPKLKAARVIARRKADTDGHASDSSSSTFSASELTGPAAGSVAAGQLAGSMRNIQAGGGGVILNANKLQN